MRPTRLGAVAVVLLATALWPAPAHLQQADGAAAGFTVTDAMIPMRDGVKLHTRVFVPEKRAEPLPILLNRTPYGVKGVEEYYFVTRMRPLVDDGYIFAFQDIRGKYGSEGQFVMVRPARAPGDTQSLDEGTDTYDTIEWLLANVPGHNGRVGMLGTSYDGWTTVMGALEPHPALRAVVPKASPADMWLGDDFHHNGAFRLSYGVRVRLHGGRGQGVAGVRVRPLRHLRLVPRAWAALERERPLPPRQDPDLERLRGPPRLRRLLETPDARPAHPRREGAHAERRRLVGPGGLLRPARDLRGARAARHAGAQPSGGRARGTTAAGTAGRATGSGPSRSTARPRSTSARRSRRPSSPTT